MRWNVIWGLARTEMRLVRRLVRYWVFVSLAAIASLVFYFYYAFIHGIASSYSATAGTISPKFLMAAFSLYYLFFFLFGLILIAFDVRARDERERIVEVLDSRPCSNLELLGGRFLGILIMSWVPAALVVLLMQAIGWLAEAFGWWMGETIEVWSVFGFLTWLMIPTLVFFSGLVFLVSVLVRHRLVTAILIVTFGAALAWLNFHLPLDLVASADVFGVFSTNFASEIAPVLPNAAALIQRFATLLFGLGFLVLAAALHPRLDSGSRGRQAIAGGVIVVLAGSVFAFGLVRQRGLTAHLEQWRAAHEALRDEPVPALESLAGTVRIDPGRHVALDLELGLAARTTALEHALFSFNPGFHVEHVRDEAGRELAFTHRDGLLDVELAAPLAAGSSSTLALSAAGAPNVFFAYLDGAINFGKLEVLDGNVALLGTDPAVFHRRYVALMPGIHWLPSPGVDVGRGDPGAPPPDFFSVDLTVEIPDGWLAAGPGRRQEAEGAAPGTVRYRFAPAAPVPEVAIAASRFERRAIEVDGVDLEILVSPLHTKNLDFFADSSDEIVAWIEEHMHEARDLGLDYPYGTFALVEVPSTLRAFGGGWRQDTTLAPPAMVLLREPGFPTSRFEWPFRKPEQFADQEGGLARAKRDRLIDFFTNDMSGSQIFLGAARNVFAYQTAARGHGALALDALCQNLTNRLVTGQDGFFSVHVFGRKFNQVIGQTLANYFIVDQRRGLSLVESFKRSQFDRPRVWERALEVPLSDLDPQADPASTLGTLSLETDALARWILDGAGRDETAHLLATLRERYRGGSFDEDELEAAAAEVGLDLDAMLGDFLDQTALPGFVASPARLVRLPDDADGTPRYQLRFHLRNAEAAPGLVRVEYRLEEEGRRSAPRPHLRTDPIEVGAGSSVEVGLVTSKPPLQVWVVPYLSLNRGAFAVPLPAVDEEKIVAEEPLVGSRPSTWEPQPAGLVVDDLDPGFHVDRGDSSSGLRLGARASTDEELDQGLPVGVFFQPPQEWSRRSIDGAWGRYRHTAAWIRAGQGKNKAVFAAELPASGTWRLDLHLPPRPAGPARQLQARGTYHLAVVQGETREELEIDASNAEAGWNQLGEIELASGGVDVEISDRTSGAVVIADAIRWRPAAAPAAGASP